MGTKYLLVFSNPVKGKEQEYNEWYTNKHLHDVLTVKGFTAAQRFKLVEDQMSDDNPYKYMAIYEIEGEDVKESLDALADAAAKGKMEISSSLDIQSLANWVFTPITERIRR